MDEAGYRGVKVLQIENDLWRFYRLLTWPLFAGVRGRGVLRTSALGGFPKFVLRDSPKFFGSA
jgi:hypothetical protein